VLELRAAADEALGPLASEICARMLVGPRRPAPHSGVTRQGAQAGPGATPVLAGASSASTTSLAL